VRVIYCVFSLIFLVINAKAQTNRSISSAMDIFNNDSQLQYATTGLYIIDAATGESVYGQNQFSGMATASTLKVITAATAFDILGKDYTYQTSMGVVSTGSGKSLYIQSSGDPTFGSWRWEETREQVILSGLKEAIKKTGIRQFESIIISNSGWADDDGIPGGWTWEDIGQYYGAGSQGMNWRENQFDVILRSGPQVGSPVSVVKTVPYLYDYKIISQTKAAGKETGDQSSLYYPSKGEKYSIIKGTIPAGKEAFTVSGSIYDPSRQFAKTLISEIKDFATIKNDRIELTDRRYSDVDIIYTHISPTLSKIIYWFLQKSINLYGEALLRTVALKQKGEATTEKGIKALQEHWQDKGVEPDELHLYDGSGLSPQNRITPHAEVMVLKYAKSRVWFTDFYEALPLYNDMKMKSGTISRVKGFTGYQQSKDGKEYIFSMLINNYNGSPYGLVRKMYKVLDYLKAP